jgi:predicted dehydrogenase
MATNELRLAVSGVSAEQFAAVAPRLPGAVIVAAANVAKDPAAAFGVSARSIDELFDKHADRFDAIVVAGPADQVSAATERAARAGKNVLAGFPFGESAEAAEKLAESCRAAGVKLMPFGSARFVPAHLAVKEALASGKLGVPGLLRIHHWSSGGDPRSELAVIDLALWCFGRLPREVYAVERRGPSGEMDYRQLHLGFGEGGMALIDVATSLPDANDYWSMSVIASTGAAYADDHHNMQLQFRGATPQALRTSQGVRALLAELQEFVKAIESDRAPSISAADVLAAWKVAQAAQASVDKQHVVTPSV